MSDFKFKEFLYSLINYEQVPNYHYDLEAFKEFLARLGSPHKKLKNVILIAGTKGKGSTVTITNSCLIASGYKVGLFTSPHLKKINERIKINNQEIADEELNRYIEIIKPHIDLKTKVGARTFFEVLTTIALMHFGDNAVDFAVLEVGLGGRLDATNVFSSHIPVITRIGYDHMNLLGNKLSQIAYEKAGIIPPPLSSGKEELARECNVVITIFQRPSVERVLKKVARERNKEIIYAEKMHEIEIRGISLKGSRLKISGKLGNFNAFLSLAGWHQIENLKIALAVLYELKKKGFQINLSAIKRGLGQTKLPGRFEVIFNNPLVIYDVAHNEDSFRALYENIKHLLKIKDRGLFFIFGCNRDKNINFAIKNLFPLAETALLVKANNPRAMEPIEIYRKAKMYQKNLIIAGSVKRAFEYLRAKANVLSPVVIFGSFYLYDELPANLI